LLLLLYKISSVCIKTFRYDGYRYH
jgi:hypothetical protein